MRSASGPAPDFLTYHVFAASGWFRSALPGAKTAYSRPTATDASASTPAAPRPRLKRLLRGGRGAAGSAGLAGLAARADLGGGAILSAVGRNSIASDDVNVSQAAAVAASELSAGAGVEAGAGVAGPGAAGAGPKP